MKNRKLSIHNNENGFTLLELLAASLISILLLALVAGVLTSQTETFVLQNQLNKVESNSRAAVDFISRAVQNSGYNVFRGQRFLAASDHYLSSVYDEDGDGVIENDEVMTFATSNVPTATTNNISIASFWDVDGDGEVEGSEARNYTIGINLDQPPFNLYKILPNASDSGTPPYAYSRIAQNIDNLILRYYDKNGVPLPAGVAVDGNGIPVPPFTVPANELNDIRRVEIEMIGRTRAEDPRDGFSNTGSYLAGSVAAVAAGSTSYTDSYHRKTYEGAVSPRNLAMVPWGKMDIAATNPTVTCPDSSTGLTATMVDGSGSAPPTGTRIRFAFAGTGGTVSPIEDTSDASGQAATTITYDWSQPSASFTVSASALLDAGGGEEKSVFSSVPVSFVSGNGTFSDLFTGGLDANWVEVNDPTMGPNADKYRMESFSFNRSVNGCTFWQDYQVEFELTPSGDLDDGRFVGGYIRYEDANNNYSALLYKQSTPNCVGGDGKNYCLRLIKWNGAVNELAKIGVDFSPGTTYKILIQAEGTDLRAKMWQGTGADPNPGVWIYDGGGFPTVYPITAVDVDYAAGQIGLLGDFNNGINVDFDNYVVGTIP